jgi:hypothetical protein
LDILKNSDKNSLTGRIVDEVISPTQQQGCY